MMESNILTTENKKYYTSLAALREVHSKLLKNYRKNSQSLELLEEIKDFIEQGRATGTILKNDDDRWDAQSRLDYWATILSSVGQELPDSTLAEFNSLNKLEQTIENIARKEHTEADILLIRQSITENKDNKLIQLGKYNVNIGEGKEIHIGDHIYQGTKAEIIRQVIQQVLKARKFYGLLTPFEFSGRVEVNSLATHQGLFVGRKAIVKKLEENISNAIAVTILYGSGGVGKTRLLLSLSKKIPDEISLWFINNNTESIESELASLDNNVKHIIVIDDAHRCNHMQQLREVLINPELAGKVKLVFATRSVFKDSLIRQLGSLSDEQINEIEITPLGNEDIDQYLLEAPYQINNQNIRHALVQVAEGNPLIAGIAARLAQKGEPIVNLNREQVLTRYLNDIIRDFQESDSSASDSHQHYIRYLQILSALGTIDLSQQEIQNQVYEIVGISSIDEERIIARLLEARLVEKYYKTIKFSSEVLADHILIQHFFDPKTKQADYQKQIIEPFFNLKPQEVLTNLAEAEFKGESSEAGLLLGQKLDELRQAITKEGNLFRFNLLHCLQKVAYLRPDDILAIVASIVDNSELEPEAVTYRWGAKYQITHKMVLEEVVSILKHTIYRGAIQDSINYLHKLALYEIDTKEYEQVRKKANEALLGIVEYRLQKPYGVQLLLLDSISNWLKEDLSGNLTLSLLLIRPMLEIEFHYPEINPIKPSYFVVQQGRLGLCDDLKEIRKRSLNILFDIYEQTENLSDRLQVVQALHGATPFFSPDEKVSTEMENYLKSNLTEVSHFLIEKVISNAQLPILDNIADWLGRAKRFTLYQIDELRILQEQLQKHRSYQLYRFLIGGCRYDDDDDDLLDWRATEEKQTRKINEYIDSISSLDSVIQDLESIVKQIRLINEENNAFGLNTLLRILGLRRSDLAEQFIKRVLNQNLELKHHLGFVLAGMYANNLDKGREYVDSWLKSDNPLLWQAIAISYRFVNWGHSQLDPEWEVIRRLVAKQSEMIDGHIFWLINRFAPFNSELAVELLKILATRENEHTLECVAEAISCRDYNNEGRVWNVDVPDLQDLQAIIDPLDGLPYLNYKAEECLARLAERSPSTVVDFIERRIKAESNSSSENKYFEAFSSPFDRVVTKIVSKPEYLDILRRVRDWTIQDDFWLGFQAPSLLTVLAPNLDGHLEDILMEWIETGDINKLKASTNILRKFNAGKKFYELSREIILRTQDEQILAYIESAIHTTPGVITGHMSNFYKQRLDEILPWLNDDNFQIRRFAKRVKLSLEEDVERQVAREELERRSWGQ
jgi:hypothetical protein